MKVAILGSGAVGGYFGARLAQAGSCYNTGTHTRGLARVHGGNGYVTRVQASAEVVVPAIRLRGEAVAPFAPPAPVAARPVALPALLNLLHPEPPGALPSAPFPQQQDAVP